MIILIRRTMAMLGSQMQHQGAVFLNDGGFRERLHLNLSPFPVFSLANHRGRAYIPICVWQVFNTGIFHWEPHETFVRRSDPRYPQFFWLR